MIIATFMHNKLIYSSQTAYFVRLRMWNLCCRATCAGAAFERAHKTVRFFSRFLVCTFQSPRQRFFNYTIWPQKPMGNACTAYMKIRCSISCCGFLLSTKSAPVESIAGFHPIKPTNPSSCSKFVLVLLERILDTWIWVNYSKIMTHIALKMLFITRWRLTSKLHSMLSHEFYIHVYRNNSIVNWIREGVEIISSFAFSMFRNWQS